MDLGDEGLNDLYEDMDGAYQRQEARLRELETWLALLVVRHGFRTDLGWRYEMASEEADLYRGAIRSGADPRVIVTAALDGIFELDVF